MDFLPLELSFTSTAFSRTLFVKHHVAKGSAKDGTKYTLFVTNVPPFSTESDLRKWFQEFGVIEEVTVGALGENNLNTASLSNSTGAGRGYARITFKKEKSLKAVLSLAQKGTPLIVDQIPSYSGLVEWIDSFRKNRPDRDELEFSINQEMKIYDEKKEAEKKQREAKSNAVDADGFTLVTYKGKKSTPAAMNVQPKKKPKDLTLNDFYRFQVKQSRRDEIAQLRMKFEEDKKRISKLKEERRFKPY
eukprot:GCRY01003894.1.p1 GENE.GCRY01003894.1~~GCRY01003894.1.p1  ORF type:complete len:247 (+),score=21.19 GCRY01003894.1:63-803(+)